jgi:hypothetical protein
VINNRTYIFIKKNGIIRDPESGSRLKKIITLGIGIEKKYMTRDRAGLKTHSVLEHWVGSYPGDLSSKIFQTQS